MSGLGRRADALAALNERSFDVLVGGGGIVGAGVLLDATLRGCRAALVERHDFASGTSSRSSKLVHGGLRYLARGEIGIVRDVLRAAAGMRARTSRSRIHCRAGANASSRTRRSRAASSSRRLARAWSRRSTIC